MAAIITRIKKTPDETVLVFKQRVNSEYLKLCDDLYPKHPERENWVLSRMTEKDGMLINDFSWGQAFPELPDETCCIAWLNPFEKRSSTAHIEGE